MQLLLVEDGLGARPSCLGRLLCSFRCPAPTSDKAGMCMLGLQARQPGGQQSLKSQGGSGDLPKTMGKLYWHKTTNHGKVSFQTRPALLSGQCEPQPVGLTHPRQGPGSLARREGTEDFRERNPSPSESRYIDVSLMGVDNEGEGKNPIKMHTGNPWLPFTASSPQDSQSPRKKQVHLRAAR